MKPNRAKMYFIKYDASELKSSTLYRETDYTHPWDDSYTKVYFYVLLISVV